MHRDNYKKDNKINKKEKKSIKRNQLQPKERPSTKKILNKFALQQN